MKISMTVNGEAVSGEVEGRTLLVDFLRNDLTQVPNTKSLDVPRVGKSPSNT